MIDDKMQGKILLGKTEGVIFGRNFLVIIKNARGVSGIIITLFWL